MVSSVVSNPNERLVNNRVENDLESSDDTLSTQAKPVSRLLTRKLLLGVVVLFFLAGVSVVSYFLFSKYKMLNKFKRELDDHLTKDFPNLERSKRDTCFDELTRLFGDGFLSDDPKLEYEVYREFEEFNSKYNRRHATQQERLNRLVTFRSNYLEVKEQKGDEPYVKGINRFSDLTEREFYKLFPVMKPPKATYSNGYYLLSHMANKTYLKNLKKALNTDEDVDLAKLTGENLDWRRSSSVTSVKDQSNCGGCWAFSTVGSVEGYYMSHFDKSYELSVQELLDCDSFSNGCQGGLLESAYEYVRKYGLVSAKDLPFVDKARRCSVPKAKKVSVPSYHVFKGKEVMTRSLTSSPCSVYLSVSPELAKYKSGVFTGECGKSLNHAVVLVGEGYDEVTKKRYWVVQNSWGTDWGENGYMRLERTNMGTDKCGVLDTSMSAFEL
ncbi:Papain family cysteine protease family protein [Theileria parva strain Muguga]|uniref:Papain family cysteine protease family protein n=1 Tax=Theileria parva strain Muguga TaxID=333668 RepID=UPI0000128D35|nr:Papain family cysteine protease family protein [Theileria parva strain Muguga]AAA30131.1 cysteine protease [Theileria parva]EAN31020.2 Papain family cysteine protease family protein [Theileria parva strain Muguga]